MGDINREGWGVPETAANVKPVAHYFEKGQTKSLCGKVVFAGTRAPDGASQGQECPACKRLLATRK